MAKRPPEPQVTDADLARFRTGGFGGTGSYPLTHEEIAARCASVPVQAIAAPDSDDPEFVELKLVGGKVKQIAKRCHSVAGHNAFVDWVNFVIEESTLIDSALESQFFTDTDLLVSFSSTLENIFGFGITKRMEKGRNFYEQSWMLGDDFGFVCHGGNNHTILVMLNGMGCTAALKGWEQRLHDYMYKADGARITRIDLTHDDYTGETYSVDKCAEQFDAGLFSAGGRHPNIEFRGNWRHPNGKGRTVYIGSRTNGKFLRVYEKGRELGDENSPWQRIEVELKNVDRIIPFGALLFPAQYLAGAYPAFSYLSVAQCKVETLKRQVKAGYEHTLQWVKHQCGSALAIVEGVEGSADKAFEILKREPVLNGALHIPEVVATPIHKKERLQHPDAVFEIDGQTPEPYHSDF